MSALYCAHYRCSNGIFVPLLHNPQVPTEAHIELLLRKKIDSIDCEGIKINDIKIDFGEIDPNERVNGLIGLDFLRKAGVILDLVYVVMYRKST